MSEQKKSKASSSSKKKDEADVKDADLSNIKNKIRRQEVYLKQKSEKAKEKRLKRKRNGDGDDDGAPKVQKTLDNLRVADETMVIVYKNMYLTSHQPIRF